MYARDEALIATPIGVIRIVGNERQLLSITIGVDGDVSRGTFAAVQQAVEQLAQWFAGERRTFALSLAPALTPRGQALRDGMVAIGYGETMSYGELARELDSAPRAIGQACARNPFPIVVPCHRVLGAGGALGHYSGGAGPLTKRWLLDHEQRVAGTRLL
jgi:methylated-DNA-[protein]-cysteine S-methyltransferase